MLGPWAWEAAQLRTSLPLPPGKSEVGRVAKGLNSARLPVLNTCQLQTPGRSSSALTYTTYHTHARKSWHFLLMMDD